MSIPYCSSITLVMTASSDRKRTTQSPYQNDGEARFVVESMPGLAWSAGQDGTLEYVNPRFLEYAGRTVEELEHAERRATFSWAQVLHAEDVEPSANAWSHGVETGEPYQIDHRIRRFDGTFRWFRVSARPVRDRDGQVIRWYGVSIDIDDRKRAEEALEASERSLASIVESLLADVDDLKKTEQSLSRLIETLPAMVWRTTPAGEADYVNHRWNSPGITVVPARLRLRSTLPAGSAEQTARIAGSTPAPSRCATTRVASSTGTAWMWISTNGRRRRRH